ncbi:MAG: hypothetical protein ACHQEB_03230 [Chitinophagales bacterium]
MTQRANILQELNEIGSTVINVTPENVYLIPAGYFENFADQVLNRIKAIEATNAKDELVYLSAVLSNISKETPYSVPAGYFDSSEERIMQGIRESEDYRTPKEELETISPLLSGLNKQMPYCVPQGYFENLNTEIGTKQETKIISITNRRWFRYAAAAMVVGVIALGGLLFFNKKSVDPNKSPDEWVAKNVKKVGTDKIDDFIKLVDEESATKGLVANKDEKPDEIKDLMKDVPESQIKEFLNETAALGNNDTEDNTSLN